MADSGEEFCPMPACDGTVPWVEDGGEVSVKLDADDRPACPKCGTELKVVGQDYGITTVYLEPCKKPKVGE